MSAIAVLGKDWEWELELASLWGEDYSLECTILRGRIQKEQMELNGDLDLLDSLDRIYSTRTRLSKRGAKLKL